MVERSRFNQLLILVAVFGFVTVLKSWYQFSYVLMWLGAIVGFYLPMVDFILYAYVLRPESQVSNEIKNLIKIKKPFRIGGIVKDLTKFEKLIFHSAYFQVIFLALTFFVVSTSASLFGRGLVYGTSLNMFLDQVWEYRKNKNISYWFKEMNLSMSKDQTRAYLAAIGFALFIFATML